jgi:3-phenylpropionate/trans-cinnamate dioxygenase ferredoxin subunit
VIDRASETFTLGPADAVSSNSVVPYYLDDRKLRVSIARIADHLYGFGGLCTHEGCPLSGGRLTGTTIMCQCDGSRFDVRTGAVINGPAAEALNVYPVAGVDGRIQIQIPLGSTRS